MNPKIGGWQHIVYFLIVVGLTVAGMICAKKFAKTEKSKSIILKSLAGALLIAIISNRISIVFKTVEPEWKWLVPDSLCGMSSLVLSLSVLLGKKDNNVLHFVWLVALIGGTITMFYPDFIGQNASIFYLPTITGLLHHSLSVVVVVASLILGNLHITYKKWFCVLFGFTSYLAFGSFLMNVCGFHDAYNMVNPLLSGTPFTIWFIAPIFMVVYAIIVFVAELIRKQKTKNTEAAKN